MGAVGLPGTLLCTERIKNAGFCSHHIGLVDFKHRRVGWEWQSPGTRVHACCEYDYLLGGGAQREGERDVVGGGVDGEGGGQGEGVGVGGEGVEHALVKPAGAEAYAGDFVFAAKCCALVCKGAGGVVEDTILIVLGGEVLLEDGIRSIYTTGGAWYVEQCVYYWRMGTAYP